MTLSLVEFVSALKGKNATNRNKVLATLYYERRYKGIESMTTAQIRQSLIGARIPKASKMNVADVLNKSGYRVDSRGVKGKERVWWLTTSGEEEIRNTLGLPEAEPEIEHDVATLTALCSKIKNDHVRQYVEEAIKCLQAGCGRACVVFLWSGAIRTIHEQMLGKGKSALNAALKKHDPKARAVSRIDHFAYVKDAVALKVAQELGIFDKGEWDMLDQALRLRNQCGHPTKYNAGPKKVSAFVEDVVGTVF